MLEDTFHDIVTLDVDEASPSAQVDKMVAGFEFLMAHRFDYVLKTEDTAFVRLDELFSIAMTKSRNGLYWGYFEGAQPVHREGKWADTNWKACDTYLPYALAGGYVLSKDLVKYVAHNAPMLKRQAFEDTTLGLWLGPLQ